MTDDQMTPDQRPPTGYECDKCQDTGIQWYPCPHCPGTGCRFCKYQGETKSACDCPLGLEIREEWGRLIAEARDR